MALRIRDEVFFDSVSRCEWCRPQTAKLAGSPAPAADLAIPSEQVLNELGSLSALLFPWWVVGS